MRALIIDDSQDTREMLIEYFRLLGLEAIGAASARDGIRELDRGNVDVVLLDLILPGMSGLDFLRVVRGSPTLKSIPVVVASGKVLRDDTESKFVREATQGFFLKPYDVEKVCAHVRLLAANRNAV